MDSVLADTLKANLKNAATEDAKLDALDERRAAATTNEVTVTVGP